MMHAKTIPNFDSAYEKLNDNLSLLGKHLTNAYNSLGSTSQTASQLGNKLDSVRQLKSGESDTL